MNYWINFCFLIKYFPSLYLLITLFEPIEFFLKYGDLILPFENPIVIIPIIVILQIILFLFFKPVEVTEDSLRIVNLKKQNFLSWNEIRGINRVSFLTPVTYSVVPKKGLPFIFFTPELSITFFFTSKAYGPTTDLISKIKNEHAL